MAKSMNWRGKNKSIKLRFNNVIPVFHTRLMDKTEIKCGCDDSLTLNSEVYVFRIESKDGKKKYHMHFGANCGRDVIELSNRINGTNYGNIYFMNPVNVRDEETVVSGYGLRNHAKENNTQRYSRFNRTYLVAIFILCKTWNEPYPYRKLAEVIDLIHQNPETDCHQHLGFFNEILKKDKRTLSQMLDQHRQQIGGSAFQNVDLGILHRFITEGLKLQSRIY